jgi:hydroxypyruvate isomerase
VEAIEERLLRHRLENVLVNLAPGNWSEASPVFPDANPSSGRVSRPRLRMPPG